MKKSLSDILHQYKLGKAFPKVTFGRRLDIQHIDRVHFGENSSIGNDIIINCGGGWSENKGAFKCGKNTYIGPKTVIFAAGEIELGDNVLISPSVNLISHQHTFKSKNKNYNQQPNDYRKIMIGNNVWIGTNATILPNVTIGDNAIIGANALVCKDVAPHTMVAGVPAKLIKSLD
jgi:acetyltransferase-like isoleucine patch superfamily enzyme